MFEVKNRTRADQYCGVKNDFTGPTVQLMWKTMFLSSSSVFRALKFAKSTDSFKLELHC